MTAFQSEKQSLKKRSEHLLDLHKPDLPMFPGVCIWLGWIPILHPRGFITTRHWVNTRLEIYFDSKSNIYARTTWTVGPQKSRSWLASQRVDYLLKVLVRGYLRCVILIHTLIWSASGIPSATHTIKPISFSMASRIALAANAGGT